MSFDCEHSGNVVFIVSNKNMTNSFHYGRQSDRNAWRVATVVAPVVSLALTNIGTWLDTSVSLHSHIDCEIIALFSIISTSHLTDRTDNINHTFIDKAGMFTIREKKQFCASWSRGTRGQIRMCTQIDRPWLAIPTIMFFINNSEIIDQCSSG